MDDEIGLGALRWVRTHGSPLILLPEGLLDAWRGAEGPTPERTDWQRASDSAGYIARVAVGRGAGVVLGDEPLPTAWLPAGSGGVLVRRVYAPSEAAVTAALAALADDLEWHWEGFAIESDGTLVLFDAAHAGDDLPADHLRIPLPPGRYDVDTFALKPNEETALLLHKLVIRDP